MVYIISASGKPLMPTKRHGRVRHLLERGEAKVIRRSPFTIQLLYDTPEQTQALTLGVDAGSKTVGISVDSEKEEVFAAELTPRNDVTKLMSTRREFRKTRRNRKTRYRQPRFNNRVHSKSEGWVAPTVDVKIHNHIQGIRSVTQILPITKIRVETGEFDLQAIRALEDGRPLPQGTDYQQGELYGEYNVRQYVLHRDNYKCRCCGAHGDGVKLHVHHLESRKTGSESPRNKITLCETCHKKYHAGLISLDGIKPGKNYRDAAFMGIMRPTLMERLRAEFPEIQVEETKGFVTKYLREKNGITKSHINDSRCIAQHPNAVPATDVYTIKPVRRHNRQIHKATINKGGIRKLNQTPKYVFGYQLFDRVRYKGEECFVFGRRASGSFDIRHLNGAKVSAGVSYKNLTPLDKRRNLLIERREKAVSSPWINPGVSTACV